MIQLPNTCVHLRSALVRKLEEDISKHKKLYDNKSPEISDEAYDRLVDMLNFLNGEPPVICVGTKTINKILSGEAVRLRNACLLPADDVFGENKWTLVRSS